MNNELMWRLAYGLIGLLVGLLLFVALMGKPHEVEVVVCPPRFTEADRVDITATYPGMPPELTDIDREFAEACGLEWGTPYYDPPPEEGA